MAQDETLSKRQDDLLTALLAGSTVEQAAEKVNISRSTAQRWVKEPVFHARYVAARRKLFDDALLVLMTGTSRALSIILKMMTDETVSPAIRLKAATTWLDAAIEIHKISGIEQELSELEQTAPRSNRWRNMLS
jgi:Homeodomain-like domain